jgi:hypothetical protein
MDRTHVLDLDRLSMYDQDGSVQLAFVAIETLVELEVIIRCIKYCQQHMMI